MNMTETIHIYSTLLQENMEEYKRKDGEMALER